MYPAEFDYYRADSVDDALELWERHDGSSGQVTYLAGGHSLLPMMKTRLAAPDVVIDIGNIDDLAGVEEGDDHLTVGATTRCVDAASSSALERAAPVITDALSSIGDRQVRNRGTVGGNIAHADPASDLPAAVIAADATVVATGPDGRRRIDADEFFDGMYATALKAGEILTHVEIPRPETSTGSAYAKRPSPSSGYALIGVAAVLRSAEEASITDARVAVNGVVDHAVRLDAVEEALVGNPSTDETASASAAVAPDAVDPAMAMEDNHASAEFRIALLDPYVERALIDALDRVGTHR